MKWSEFFTSAVGRKLVMGLTGLFLISFLVVHVGINACIWANDGGVMFNKAAHFMGSTVVIRIMEIGLFLGIFLHIIQGYMLTASNQAKRKVGYAVPMGDKGSKWYSRSMGILGTILLIFIVVHMSNFWAQYHWGGLPYTKYEIDLQNPDVMRVTELPITGTERVHSDFVDAQNGTKVLIAKDLYKIVHDSFQQWWYVLLYVISMAALSFHLIHGFRSAFQTLGWDHKRYVPLIRFLGVWIFGVIIPVLFAAMPLFFFFFK